MKKCLHQKKTKPHRRPKAIVQISFRERMRLEREAAARKRARLIGDRLGMLGLLNAGLPVSMMPKIF